MICKKPQFFIGQNLSNLRNPGSYRSRAADHLLIGFLEYVLKVVGIKFLRIFMMEDLPVEHQLKKYAIDHNLFEWLKRGGSYNFFIKIRFSFTRIIDWLSSVKKIFEFRTEIWKTTRDWRDKLCGWCDIYLITFSALLAKIKCSICS